MGIKRDDRSKGILTRYQKSEIELLRRRGWTIGRVIRYANADNPWATIEISKGHYKTKAGFPTTKAVEKFILDQAPQREN